MNNNGFDQYGRPIEHFAEPPRQPVYPQDPQGESPRSPEQKERKTATGRDMVFALLCLVFSILTIDFLFWSGAGIGISVCAAAILFVSVAYLSQKGIKISAYTVILSVLYLALSAGLTFSDGGFPKFLALFLMGIIYTLILMDGMSLRRFESGTFKSIGDICYCIFALTFGKIGRAWYGVFHKKEGDRIVSRKTGSVFIGFAFAIPVLCIVIPLLVSSDAAFEGLLHKVSFAEVWEILCSILLGAFVFLLWFGQIFSAPDIKRERAERKSSRGGVEPTVILSFLAVISAAYMLYLLSQLAYFFNAFSRLLPDGFTMAQYARRGFFEMVAVCAINLFIIFLVSLIVRRKTEYAPVSVRVLSLFLCAFSMVLIATSLSKIVMYINSYGMTRLRIFTSVFAVFLAVVFIAVAVRLFVKRMPYMKAAIIAAAILTAAMCYLDVDGMIAKYNVEAYLDGRLDTVDTDALYDLSSDAVVPYVLQLMDDPDTNVQVGARRVLRKHAHELLEIEDDPVEMTESARLPDYDFRRYNIYEYKAARLLYDNFESFNPVVD